MEDFYITIRKKGYHFLNLVTIQTLVNVLSWTIKIFWTHVFHYDEIAAQLRRSCDHTVTRNCEKLRRSYAQLRWENRSFAYLRWKNRSYALLCRSYSIQILAARSQPSPYLLIATNAHHLGEVFILSIFYWEKLKRTTFKIQTKLNRKLDKKSERTN